MGRRPLCGAKVEVAGLASILTPRLPEAGAVADGRPPLPRTERDEAPLYLAKYLERQRRGDPLFLHHLLMQDPVDPLADPQHLVIRLRHSPPSVAYRHY